MLSQEIPTFIAKEKTSVNCFNPVINTTSWWFLSKLNFSENPNKCKVIDWTYSGFSNGSIFVKIYGIK